MSIFRRFPEAIPIKTPQKTKRHPTQRLIQDKTPVVFTTFFMNGNSDINKYEGLFFLRGNQADGKFLKLFVINC